ncbi:MAG TPA: serine/threonine-protein kinase [Kofleriaceae bacterium]|nr:serine/threonine-protein kinase [Kofleriaceae bacterium]
MTTASRFAPAEETELYCPACDQSFSVEAQHCPNDGTRLVRLSDVRDPLIGRNLEGRFLIKERLGTGGMGAVYRAWQGSVGREVAVKVIESRLKGGRLAAKRFLREAKLASRLSHANTVGVIDFGQTEDGLLYLVMELVKGRTMGDVLLEDGPFSVDRMIRIGVQLCDALQAAHKLSIIHRDLKPSNVIVLDDPPGRDHVKVLDFGLAKSLVDEGMTTVTQSDAIMGTPSYIPPEAVTRMQFDERSDLYSLGVILYEVLAGRLPFDATTVQAMLRQHAYDAPKPLPDTVPAPVVELLFRLLEKEPDRRPQSAAEVHDALVLLAAVPERGTPLPISRRVLTSAGGFPAPNTPVGPAVARSAPKAPIDQTMTLGRRSRPWLLLGLAGVALSSAAVLIASGVFDRGQTRQATAPPIVSPAPPAAPAAEPPPPAAAAVGSSPAAIPAPRPGPVVLDLRSDPDHADIVIGGNRVGKTPLQHEVPRGEQPISIEFRRNGFRPETRDVVPDGDKRVSVSLDRVEPRPAPVRTGGKTGKTGGARSGKSTGAKSTPAEEKPPTKPPVKFVP